MNDFAGSADQIAKQLVAGGMEPDRAMMMALRMAQSRQQADESILGGVPTQPPTSDVPPATEILGGDPSKLFQRQPTTMERVRDLPKDVLGAGEALVSMGSLAALAPASMLYALRPGQKTQGDPMEFALRNMYMPRSERGPSHLAGLGEVLESLPQTGPLPELQAFTGVGRGVGRQLAEKGRQAGRAMAPAAANVAEDILRRQGLLMDVVKPKGGNFIGGDVPENIDRQLAYLKTPLLAGESPAQRIPRHEQLLQDPKLTEESRQTVQRHLEQERKFAALDNWIERNLSNYVKKEMGTPEDPVRKLAESGVTHIQERYDEPGLTTVIKRKEAGFPKQGIGQSPEARSWENLSDRSIDDYLAGTIQPQAGYVKDFERLNEELSDFGRQIRERFFNERTERLVRLGETRENAKQIINDSIANKSNGELAKELNDPDLLKQYSTLRARTNYARSLLDEEYANILRQNPWVEKLDPNTRLYTARTENLQFDHIVDVLRDDLDSGRIRPEQLSKVSMADAVRRTYEFDQEMAKKAEQAQAELANKLLNESPFKVYENGYKWVKLPDPASSDEAMKLVQDIGCQGGWCTQKETNALYYGAHGEGNNLFVLMSPDKRVHAQIHVQSPEKPYDFDALMSDPQTKAQAAQAVREWRQRNPNVETPLEDDQIYQALREAGIPEQSPAISEIKPRANSWTSQMVADQVAKDPEYKNTIRSMLSDFVQTTKYPVEWDLENAGLVAIDRASDLAKAMRAAKEEVPRYVTNEELSRLLQKYVPQRYKQGGSVNHKAVASARRALEKAMAKGGEVKMGTGGSMLGTVAGRAAAAGKAGAKAAKAAKAEDEKTLPLVLQRAPAKTKQELQAEAERVGRQIIGEHVTKPGDTANLADYSKKVADRLRAMQEGQDYVLRETKPTAPLASMDPAAGSVLIALPGDISIADKELMKLGKLKVGSKQEGGPRYGAAFTEDPVEMAKFWASNYGPANIFQKKVTELGGMYPEQDILGAYMSMGRTGMNFAQHFADANLKAIRSAIKAGDVSKDDIESFNKMIREGWSKINQKTGEREYFKYPEFAGVEKTGEAYAQMMRDPELRKWFNDRMKTSKETASRGLPSGLDIEYAISEPELRNLEHSLVGFSLGRMQPGKELVAPVEHATYSHGIPGQAVGRLPGHVPVRVVFPDAAKVIAETKRPQDFTGTIQKVFPHQVVDQQWQDEVGQYLDYLKRITGRKKGGLMKKSSKLPKVIKSGKVGGLSALRK